MLRPQLFALPSLVVAPPLAAQDTASAPRSTGPVWQIVPQPQSSLVFARDGSLIGEIGRESRTTVSIRTLPKYVGQAFVAVEDQRFYQHDGVGLIRVAGGGQGKEPPEGNRRQTGGAGDTPPQSPSRTSPRAH